jgi:hypothetical protein
MYITLHISINIEEIHHGYIIYLIWDRNPLIGREDGEVID